MKKRTKIVATISDRNCDVEFIRELHEKGADVVRLNTAHQTFDMSLKVINNVRAVSDKIPLMIDTKGPEIRTTETEDDIYLETGDSIAIKGDATQKSTKDCISVNYKHFVKDVPVGSTILVNDGEIGFTVLSKDDERLFCVAQNNGKVGSRKSVNIPGVHVNLPSVNDKDRSYIDFAIEHDVDFIAHSFVRNKEDIKEIQDILDERKSRIKIIAKIESQAGVDNIDEIIENAYGIMVARGDLGIEIPMEKLPAVQRLIVRKCIENKKPVIIATQMLHTMIDNPRPTRAEVSDVANAIFRGTDAIMLSGETAFGKYPIEAVETMTRIAIETESSRIDDSPKLPLVPIENETAVFLAKSAVRASRQLPTKAVMLDTYSGQTARFMSAFRGKNPVYALCYDKRVMRELALSYGICGEYYPNRTSNDQFKREACSMLIEKGYIKPQDLIMVVAGSFGISAGATFLEINIAENMTKAGTLPLNFEEL